MNTQYDEKLKEIPIYKLHPSFLPYVGDDYEVYKVLHVGESHYIDNEAYDYAEKCEIVSIDDFIKEEFTFLKADIEGYEYKMLEGAII